MRKRYRNRASNGLSRSSLGGRVSRNLERPTGAIAAAALMLGEAMLVLAPVDPGWHHNAGEVMITAGIFSISAKALRRDRGRR